MGLSAQDPSLPRSLQAEPLNPACTAKGLGVDDLRWHEHSVLSYFRIDDILRAGALSSETGTIIEINIPGTQPVVSPAR